MSTSGLRNDFIVGVGVDLEIALETANNMANNMANKIADGVHLAVIVHLAD